jgi:DNA sulfur modification protein DndB
MRLDQYPSSPIRDRILTVDQDKTHVRCLTLTSFVDGLSGNNLIGSIPRSSREIDPGPLAHPSGDSAKTREKAVITLSKYLNLFAENLEEHWRAGDEKSGYICTNNGIRALLVLLRRVIAFVETHNGIRARALEPDDIIEYIKPYIGHVVDYFKSASTSDISAFRSRGSSLLSVDQNCFQMMAIIHDVDSSFQTRELSEYVSKLDIEGTKEATLLVDEINRVIFEHVVEQLKAKYGNEGDVWWEQGVPRAIRIASYERYTGESKPPRKAASSGLDPTTKHIRNITHHVEKGPLSKDQVDYVRRAHRLVKKHIEGRQKVVAGTVYLSEEREEEFLTVTQGLAIESR